MLCRRPSPPPRQGKLPVVSWAMTRVRIWGNSKLSVGFRGCCECEWGELALKGVFSVGFAASLLLGGFPCALGPKNGRKFTRDAPPLNFRPLSRGTFFRPHAPSGGPSSPLQPSETGHFFSWDAPAGHSRRQEAPGQSATARHTMRRADSPAGWCYVLLLAPPPWRA
jgi:hypothetical protein